jgi:hypothetical protein
MNKLGVKSNPKVTLNDEKSELVYGAFAYSFLSTST